MEITILVLASIVLGIVEMLKGLIENKKMIPPIALGIGVMVMIIGGDLVEVTTAAEKLLVGLVLGLSSMGLYSGAKTMIEKEEKR